MKKLLLACSLIGIMSAANAQSTQPVQSAQPMMSNRAMGDHPMSGHMLMGERALDPAEHATQLQKTLQLSDEQTAKVKKVFEDTAQQRKALEDKYKPQFETFRADMKKLHEQTHTQLNAILTPKQQQALEAQRKEHGGGICPDDKDGEGRMREHGEKMPLK